MNETFPGIHKQSSNLIRIQGGAKMTRHGAFIACALVLLLCGPTLLEAQWKQTQLKDLYVSALCITDKGTLAVFARPDMGPFGRKFEYSVDRGFSWQDQTSGIDPKLFLRDIQSDAGLMYMGTNYGLYISDDECRNWRLMPGMSSRMMNIARFDVRDTIVVISNRYGWSADEGPYTFVSTDGGTTWVDLGTQGGRVWDEINTVWIHDSVVWLSGTGVIKFTGWNYLKQHWQGSMPIKSVFRIAATKQNVFAEEDSGRILRSPNMTSIMWTEVTVPWTIKPGMLRIIGQNIFFGDARDSSGVAYLSQDEGETWKLISDGLPQYNITGFGLSHDTVFVSLYGGGIWYRPFAEIALGTEDKPGASVSICSLDQNYPNPFTGRTSVRFTAPARENVKLEVFDMLGRRVKTLVDELKEPGEHQVSFDGSGLHAGMYVYSLQAGAVHLERQMCLMK